MGIQLFVPTFHVNECLEEIKECLEKGWTGLGFKTVAIEEAWKSYTGLPHAHYLNSATAGLHLAVEILKEQNGWEDGDEIISTPLTFISTNHAAVYAKLKVVFADIDQYLCLSPDDIKNKISEKTRAVILVGLGGSTGQYEKIVEICRENRLKLIVDAAHMAGTRLHGNIPGVEADVVVYSFQAVKNLPTADSGMICFKEEKYDEIARKKAWLGINKDTFSRTADKGAYKWKYDVEYVGYKYNGNSIMAAIALVQLKYLDQEPIGCESSRHLYQIQVNNRDELLLALNESEIYPGVHYVDNTEYDMFKYAAGSCPRASKVSNRIISLPMHLRLNKKDVDLVANTVIKYAK